MEVTIFKDILDTSRPFYRDVSVILDRIRGGASKDLIKEIRSESDKIERNKLKGCLPAVCFSGKFSKRNDSSLIEHSGLICLDFDGYDSYDMLLEEKQRLTEDRYVYSVFISPSGMGLKVLVKIPPDENSHKNFFNSLKHYFDSKYFDDTSKNLSRVCYESYDPAIWLNEQSSVFNQITEQEYQEVAKFKDRQTIPITDENRTVEILMKWWTRKYGVVAGERNQNVYILAAKFNEFGINKTVAEFIMKDFAMDDFPQSEIKRTIQSAYSNTQNFGTKYFEDEEMVNEVKHKLRRGVPKKEIKSYLEKETGLGDVVTETVINRLETEQDQQKFWEFNSKGSPRIVHISFKKFLEDNGYYKFNPQGSKNYVFVKVTNNLIDHTSEKEIKDFVLDYLIDLEDHNIYNYFAESTKYFREEFLTLLSSINVFFIEDTKDSAYLYYKNCAVKITKDDIVPIDYLDLGGYVWKDHVIDREFDICNVVSCDYKTFISNISGGTEKRIRSMESTIGYMLHGHKNLSWAPATVLNDEVISDNPEGGTGKGIYCNALSQMKKLVVIDGKSFNFEKSFAYQTVSADTQILVFDDVKKHFDFERLFSVITEGLTLEKKNRDAIKIPFKKSPKIIITTNYAIRGKGSSFERRKWELELAQHYTKDYTPLVEFGRMMFDEWNDNEWCQFDNYMIKCLQLYLDKGLLKSEFVNLKVRRFSAETSHEFVEWCGVIGGQLNEKLIKDIQIPMNELYLDFIDEYPDFAPKAKMTISRIRFNKWLHTYAHYKYGCDPIDGRNSGGKWIKFVNKHYYEKQSKL